MRSGFAPSWSRRLPGANACPLSAEILHREAEFLGLTHQEADSCIDGLRELAGRFFVLRRGGKRGRIAHMPRPLRMDYAARPAGSKAVIANRCVFLFFTTQLVFLQFTAGGGRAYFSMYVSKQWHFSGYLLYGAIIYLFSAYSLALMRERRFVTAMLQLVSLLLLIGVMLYPFNSVNHVLLLPFLAALQPIILFVDHNFRSWDDFHDVERTLWDIVVLLFVTPLIFLLMAFPVVEKVLIYGVIALLFAVLQSKIRRCRPRWD
jgi:hypothetical protein